MFETKTNANDFIGNIETLNQHIKELMNLPTLTHKELTYLYNMAANKCQAGDFTGAIALFQFLVLTERSNKIYIKGLAGSLHGAERYSEALDLYQIVYLIDVDLECDCLFYSADCLFNLGKYETAKDNLERFIQLNEHTRVQDSFMLKRANLLLAAIPK